MGRNFEECENEMLDIYCPSECFEEEWYFDTILKIDNRVEFAYRHWRELIFKWLIGETYVLEDAKLYLWFQLEIMNIRSFVLFQIIH